MRSVSKTNFVQWVVARVSVEYGLAASIAESVKHRSSVFLSVCPSVCSAAELNIPATVAMPGRQERQVTAGARQVNLACGHSLCVMDDRHSRFSILSNDIIQMF